MQFISIYFCAFMLITLVGYYHMPGRYRYVFVLICNILYYATWISDIRYFFSLITVTLITYTGARVIGRFEVSKQLIHDSRFAGEAINLFFKRLILSAVIVLTIGSLLYFKYAIFFAGIWNDMVNIFSLSLQKKSIDIIMPVGISFYTFQALGYFIDVYMGKIKEEHNLLLYSAYVSFFPVITSGPIERADSLLEQLKKNEKNCFSFVNLEKGIILILWGAFVKLVVADRLAVIVNTVFAGYEKYGGVILFVISMAYTLQIYCDFSSYSLIAIGIGKLLGINIKENFNAPYFSENIQDFWRRWHISLSTWFRDYVYIPLGGNRCSKCRKNFNLFITFLVSGLWHGANWTFVVWGCIHGIYQIVGNATQKIRHKICEKIEINRECFSFRFGKILGTFLLVSFAWIFFRAENLVDAFDYISRMVMYPDLWDAFNLSIYDLGLNVFQMNILSIALIFVVIMDWLKYRTQLNMDELLMRQNWIFKGMVIIFLFTIVFVFGMYGPAFDSQEFIYFQF